MSENNLTDPPTSHDKPSTELVSSAAVPEKLEKIIEGVPEPQQHAFREIIREFMGVFHSKTASPFDVDPAIVKILAESQTKDNDNKFEFAKQRQHDSHELAMKQHCDRFSVMRPVTFVVTVVLAICLFIGIFLAVYGHETLGSCILTAVITSILAYLGGLGTADLIKGGK